MFWPNIGTLRECGRPTGSHASSDAYFRLARGLGIILDSSWLAVLMLVATPGMCKDEGPTGSATRGDRTCEPKVERNPIPVSEAVDFAWSTFKKHYDLFSAILLTIFGSWICLEIVVIAGQRFGILLWAVAHLAFLLFFASIEIGFLQICLGLYDGREPRFSDAFAHWYLGLKFLAGQVFLLLAVVIGLALLIVPGAYFGVRYALFGFCLAAGEADLIRSFRQSAILSNGARIKLFGIFAALLFLNVLGACLLGLGLLITIPLSALVATAIYRQLSSR